MVYMKNINDRQIRQNIFSVILPGLKALLTNSPKAHRLILSLAESKLVISANGSSEQISYNSIRSIAIEKKLFGANLYLSFADNGLKQICFLPKKRLIEFKRQLITSVKTQLYKDSKQLFNSTQSVVCKRINNEPLCKYIDRIHNELRAAFASERYFKIALKNHFQQILNAYTNLFAANRNPKIDIDKSIAAKLDYLENVFKNLDLLVEKHNRRYTALRLESDQNFFNRIESHPLTDEQRDASVIDDSRNLVIASAGSGKTSVIVAKAGSMIKNGDISADEILILSFAKDSVKEIKDRIRKNLVGKFRLPKDKDIVKSVMTFHSLGLKIVRSVAKSRGKKVPEVYTKSEQGNKGDMYNNLINLLDNDKEKNKLIDYLVQYYKPAKSMLDLKTEKDFRIYKRDSGYISFKGHKVKSFEESVIANFLFIYGVEYDYEKEYEIDRSVYGPTVYRPDFTITYKNGRTIYLEHFCIDENDEPPPFFTPNAKEKYKKGIKWKRALHEKNGTILVESYSYWQRRGVLIENIQRILEHEGVVFKLKSAEELEIDFKKYKVVDGLAEFILRFMTQFKSAQLNLQSLKKRIERSPIRQRGLSFYKVFQYVYKQYEAELENRNKIDFNDMINWAIKHLRKEAPDTSPEYISPCKAIIVDEFQDIALGRKNLILELANQRPLECSVFCVGDDFQAIYGFTGCNIAYIKEFETYFGQGKTVRLNKTFRFNNKIGEVANKFIEKNTMQKKKEFKTHAPSIYYPAVSIIKTDAGRKESIRPTQLALNKIIIDSGLDVNKNGKVKVFVLTRYKATRDQQKRALQETIDKYAIDYPELNIEFMTAHASKGLGADYVVVLDLNSKGFPSEKTNDPLLEMVLATEEDEFKETFPFAEERRLLYVAMTRTKNRCYLIAKTPDVSCFISEICADNDESSIEIINDCKQNRLFANTIKAKCPVCEEAYLYQISEEVYKCSSHYCEAFIRICCSCGQGFIVPRSDGKYECDKCSYEPLLCKWCEGFMVYKKNQKTGADFLGCSRYRIDGKVNCGYTISIPEGYYRSVLKIRSARLAQNKQNQITDQSSPIPF